MTKRADRTQKDNSYGWAPAAAAAAVAVAGILRGGRLSGYDGLTGDEGFTLALVQRPFFRMLSFFAREANGILYPLIASPLVRLHESLAVLRLPALVAGTLAVAALYWTGVRLADRRAAVIAAGLLAVSPLAVSYSQLARPYVFGLLFGTISFGCLAQALARDATGPWWPAYIAATAAAAYSSALTIMLLAVPQLILVLEVNRRALRRWLFSALALGCLLTPLVVLILLERSKRDPLYWLNRPTIESFEKVARDFMGGGYGLLAGVLTVSLAIVLPALPPSSGPFRSSAWAQAPFAIAAWALLPLPLLFLASQISPLFWVGYTLPVLPGVLLLISIAVTRLPLPVASVALLVLTALLLRASLLHSENYHPAGWQRATRALANLRQPRDPVIFDIPDGLVAAGFYDRSLAGPDGRVVVSEWKDERLPSNVTLLDDPGGYGRTNSGPPSQALIRRLENRTGVIFLMIYETAKQGDSREWPGLKWAARKCRVRRARFGGIEMIRVEGCRTGGGR